MADLLTDIQMAQVEAGENVVVERLRRKGLLPREDGTWTIDQRQRLEHSLATTFVELQRERDPLQRQAKWMECWKIGLELQKLNDK